MTWYLLGSMHDYARTFLPFAGAFTVMEDSEIDLMENYDSAMKAERAICLSIWQAAARRILPMRAAWNWRKPSCRRRNFLRHGFCQG